MRLIDKLYALDHGPRFHGNGFTQLYLNDHQRLHVWSPELPEYENNNATIHDHIWHLTSDVLYGQLEHNTYELQDSLSPTHNLWMINQPNVRKQTGEPFMNLGAVRVTPSARYFITAGSRYMFPPRKFHTSKPHTSLVATIITKSDDYHESPRLVAPLGEVPTQAFDPIQAPPLDSQWRAIETVVETYLSGSARDKIEEAITR